MISYPSNINIYREEKLLKEVKELRKKIADSKVGKASSNFGDERSSKFNSDLRKFRAEYSSSISELRRVRKLKINKKSEQRREVQQEKEYIREIELKKYQDKNQGSYSYISNFNKSKVIYNYSNTQKIFNIYI